MFFKCDYDTHHKLMHIYMLRLRSHKSIGKIGSPTKKHFLFPAFHKLARIQPSLLCIYTQVVKRTNHVSPNLQLTSHKLCKLEVRYEWVESFSC